MPFSERHHWGIDLVKLINMGKTDGDLKTRKIKLDKDNNDSLTNNELLVLFDGEVGSYDFKEEHDFVLLHNCFLDNIPSLLICLCK